MLGATTEKKSNLRGMPRWEVTARVASDDGVESIRFDATPWFEVATDDDLLELAARDWRDCPQADAAALYVYDANPKSPPGRVFRYLRKYNPMRRDGSIVGFEVRVQAKAATAWVVANRPHLAAMLDHG